VTDARSTSPASRDRLIPPGERVLLDASPSLLQIFLEPLGTMLALLVMLALTLWVLPTVTGRAAPTWLAWSILGLLVLRAIWSAVLWSCRRYVLTDQRILASVGVIRRVVVDVPLKNIQHLRVIKSRRERLTGIGTLAVDTSGNSDTEIYWFMIDKPEAALAAVRAAMQAAASPLPGGEGIGEGFAKLTFPTPSDGQSNMLVLGLIGGIGAGKSAVAAALSRRGFQVIDSDKEAKAALDLPHVRDQLVAWWGNDILAPDGRVDRSKVAAIVFGDPAQRRRLEELVHPIVKGTRAQMVARARAQHMRGVVVDAPLLLEAGVDKECDAVLFVDAPLEQRLERVKSTRGWTEDELRRRESAQTPLEEKRRRADETIVNDADLPTLERRVDEALARLDARR
jgi:dephospho-CoA kinase